MQEYKSDAGKVFFHNIHTKESRWTIPRELEKLKASLAREEAGEVREGREPGNEYWCRLNTLTSAMVTFDDGFQQGGHLLGISWKSPGIFSCLLEFFCSKNLLEI